jgi:formylglycine-generating enzyme required for sulfatase activity
VTDSPTTPRAGIWPLAAMALLLGMLTIFLIMKWARPDPAAAKPAPVHTVDKPTPATNPVKPETTNPVATTNPSTNPPPVQDDPRDKEVAARLEEARKAITDGRLDLAQEAVAAARKIKPLPAIDAVEAEVQVAISRKIEKEKQERKAKLDDLAFKAAEAAEAHWKQSRYLTARKTLDDAVAAEPDLKSHPFVERAQEKLASLVNGGALSTWQHYADLAKKAADAGRHASAMRAMRQARKYFADKPETQPLYDGYKALLGSAQMARIPAGLAFKLGTPGRKDEPEREFKGGAFLIDKYEVTNEDYAEFIVATDRKPPVSKHWVKDPVTGSDMVRPDAERWPIVGITAAEAEAYAAWLGKRLPTEDEWEYAARAIDGRTYPWGNDFPTGKEIKCNSVENLRGGGSPYGWTPVGSFPNGASAYDVFDLSGNVAEWTSTPDVLGDRKVRVIKGGSFIMPAEACRAAARFLDDPALAHHEVGFRCVKFLEK